jgi:hypothetical protein
LNLVPGKAVPNLVVAPLTGGSTCVTPSAATNLLVDVAGYLPAGADGITVLGSPPRLVDTRAGLGSPIASLDQTPRPLQLTGLQGVPADADAVLVNLTATRTTAAGYVTVAPCGQPPQVSNLNVDAGIDVANAALLPVGPDGTVCATASARVDLLLDVTGYLAGEDDIVPVSPTRIHDSRADTPAGCGLALLHAAPTLLWVVDVATGQTVHEITNDRFDDAGFFKQTLLHAKLLPGCDGVLVWNPIDYLPPLTTPDHRFELLDVRFDGSLTVLGEVSGADAVLLLPDSVIAVPSGGVHVDIRTAAPVVRLPADRRVWHVLDDGRIVTIDPENPDRSEYWQRRALDDPLFPDAEPVADDVPVLGAPSPTGRFQLVDSASDLRVVTEDGSTVATLRAADLPSMPTLLGFEWYSDSTVIVCARFAEPLADGTTQPVSHPVVWNMFTGTTAVWTQTACATDAR